MQNGGPDNNSYNSSFRIHYLEQEMQSGKFLLSQLSAQVQHLAAKVQGNVSSDNASLENIMKHVESLSHGSAKLECRVGKLEDLQESIHNSYQQKFKELTESFEESRRLAEERLRSLFVSITELRGETARIGYKVEDMNSEYSHRLNHYSHQSMIPSDQVIQSASQMSSQLDHASADFARKLDAMYAELRDMITHEVQSRISLEDNVTHLASGFKITSDQMGRDWGRKLDTARNDLYLAFKGDLAQTSTTLTDLCKYHARNAEQSLKESTSHLTSIINEMAKRNEGSWTEERQSRAKLETALRSSIDCVTEELKSLREKLTDQGRTYHVLKKSMLTAISKIQDGIALVEKEASLQVTEVEKMIHTEISEREKLTKDLNESIRAVQDRNDVVVKKESEIVRADMTDLIEKHGKDMERDLSELNKHFAKTCKNIEQLVTQSASEASQAVEELSQRVYKKLEIQEALVNDTLGAEIEDIKHKINEYKCNIDELISNASETSYHLDQFEITLQRSKEELWQRQEQRHVQFDQTMMAIKEELQERVRKDDWEYSSKQNEEHLTQILERLNMCATSEEISKEVDSLGRKIHATKDSLDNKVNEIEDSLTQNTKSIERLQSDVSKHSQDIDKMKRADEDRFIEMRSKSEKLSAIENTLSNNNQKTHKLLTEAKSNLEEHLNRIETIENNLAVFQKETKLKIVNTDQGVSRTEQQIVMVEKRFNPLFKKLEKTEQDIESLSITCNKYFEESTEIMDDLKKDVEKCGSKTDKVLVFQGDMKKDVIAWQEESEENQQRLQNSIESVKSQIDNLQYKEEQNKATFSNFQLELSSTKASTEKVTKALHSHLETYRTFASQTDNDINTHQTTLSELLQRGSITQKNVAELEHSMLSIQTGAKELREKIQGMDDDYAEAISAIEENQKEFKSSEEELYEMVVTLKREGKEVTEQARVNSTAIAGLSGNFLVHKDQVEHLALDLSDFKKMADTKDHSLRQSTEEVSKRLISVEKAVRCDIETVDKKSSTMERDISALKICIEKANQTLETETKKAESNYTGIVSKIASLEGEQKALIDKTEGLVESEAQNIKTLQKCVEKQLVLDTDVKEAQKTVSALGEQILRSEQQVTHQHQALEAKTLTVSAAIQHLERKVAELARVDEGERDHLKQKITTLQSMKVSLDDQLDRLNAQIRELKEGLNNTRNNAEKRLSHVDIVLVDQTSRLIKLEKEQEELSTKAGMMEERQGGLDKKLGVATSGMEMDQNQLIQLIKLVQVHTEDISREIQRTSHSCAELEKSLDSMKTKQQADINSIQSTVDTLDQKVVKLHSSAAALREAQEVPKALPIVSPPVVDIEGTLRQLKEGTVQPLEISVKRVESLLQECDSRLSDEQEVIKQHIEDHQQRLEMLEAAVRPGIEENTSPGEQEKGESPSGKYVDGNGIFKPPQLVLNT
jgi:chromosome segregation ATPase